MPFPYTLPFQLGVVDAAGSLSYGWAADGGGSRAPKASSGGAYRFAGSAAGLVTRKSSGVAGFSFAIGGAGKRAPKTSALPVAYRWAVSGIALSSPGSIGVLRYSWATGSAGLVDRLGSGATGFGWSVVGMGRAPTFAREVVYVPFEDRDSTVLADVRHAAAGADGRLVAVLFDDRSVGAIADVRFVAVGADGRVVLVPPAERDSSVSGAEFTATI